MYSEYYRLLEARKIRDMVIPLLKEGYSLKRIWKRHQLPVWPMSYRKFMYLANEANIDKRIEEIEAKAGRRA